MTNANHDMPPRQPDENEPVDHPARDILDFIDETVTRITDADVDEHLRKVLDLSGYYSRHTQSPGTAPRAGNRSAADPRRRPVSRFLVALSGAVPEIVDKVPAERVKFESQGSAILITAIMAVVSMWFALASAVGINGILAAPIALLWGLVILGIDRWLVISLPPGSTRRKIAIAVPRLALALLLGTLISTPLVLRIFQQEINTEIPVIRQQQLSEFLANSQRSQLNRQVNSLQGQVENLQQVIDSRGEVPVNPSTDPVVQTLTTQRNSEIALQQKYYLQWQCEIDGIQGQGCSGSSGVLGIGPLAQADRESYEHAVTQVNKLNGEIQNRENQLVATDAAAQSSRLQQAMAALPEAQTQLKTAQDQLNTLLDSFSAQNSADNGALIRLEALDRLANNDSAINSERLLLFLLFLVIECLPVTVKLLQRPGDYERILARIIIDERMKLTTYIWKEQRQSPAARQEGHLPPAPRPQDITPARASSDAERLAVPDHLKNEIESIYPFMKDPGETTAPAYREELENCFLAISEAVNELRRDKYDDDQIAEALRITAKMATQQLAEGWQAALARESSS